MGSPNISNNPSQLKINEDIFIQILKKEKPVTTPQKKVYKKNRIYSNMRILSNTALDIKPKKYYKFPFTHIKNFTNDMQKEWLIAIKNAFYNFTNNNKPFYLLFIDSLLIFRDGKVKTDTKLVDMFDKEDIKYKRKGESIVFSGVDIKMLFDFVVNYEYMKTLPFILSKSKFVNSVYYKNVVRMCGIVKNQDKMQYHYNLSGFFFVNDYKKLFEHELSFDL